VSEPQDPHARQVGLLVGLHNPGALLSCDRHIEAIRIGTARFSPLAPNTIDCPSHETGG
jgi:hypothetical protein